MGKREKQRVGQLPTRKRTYMPELYKYRAPVLGTLVEDTKNTKEE